LIPKNPSTNKQHLSTPKTTSYIFNIKKFLFLLLFIFNIHHLLPIKSNFIHHFQFSISNFFHIHTHAHYHWHNINQKNKKNQRVTFLGFGIFIFIQKITLIQTFFIGDQHHQIQIFLIWDQNISVSNQKGIFRFLKFWWQICMWKLCLQRIWTGTQNGLRILVFGLPISSSFSSHGSLFYLCLVVLLELLGQLLISLIFLYRLLLPFFVFIYFDYVFLILF
jgi:hypothetical protein